MSNFWKRGLGVSALTLIVLLLVGLLVSKSDAADDTAPTASAEDTQCDTSMEILINSDCWLKKVGANATDEGEPPSEDELIEKDLTVKIGDLLPERAQCTNDAFIDHSLREVRAGDPEFRQTADAVSIPVTSLDANEVLNQVMAENCGNPTELHMNVQALNELTVGEFNIGKGNPWLGEFLKMERDHAVDDESGLRTAFLVKKQGADGIFVTADYQSVAELVNTLLLKFQNQGFLELDSAKNWHIGLPVAKGLPLAVVNPNQEGLPALVLEYTIKDGCSLVRIGFNAQDKRIEFFPQPVCEEVTPPEDTAPPEETSPPATNPPGTNPPGTPPPDTNPPQTTVPDTTVPNTPPTTAPCGDKNVRDPATGKCVPAIPSGSTLPAPGTTTPTATTVQPPPQPPATDVPDPTPSDVTIVDQTPPPNTYTPPGAVDGTTPPPATAAPPATPAVTAPPGGGSTPSR